MNHNRTLTLVFIATLLASPLAFAQPDGAAGSGGDDAAADAPPAGKRFGKHRGKHFDRIDANGDGSLTLDEMKQGLRTRFGAADSDGDGSITQDEMKAHFEAKRAEMRARFEARRAEAGDDGERGKRFGKHGKRFGKHGKRFGKRHGKHFARLDRDGNGSVELSELDAMASEHFAEADADADGKVTRDELRAAHHARRGECGKHRGKPGKGKAGKAPAKKS